MATTWYTIKHDGVTVRTQSAATVEAETASCDDARVTATTVADR